MLESAYESAICHELALRHVPFQRQHAVPVRYKGCELDISYRIDLLVDGLVIVELKSIDALNNVHDAQLLTYMRLLRKRIGLLINFNVPVLKDGIRRRILSNP